jgi:hypothetical protein
MEKQKNWCLVSLNLKDEFASNVVFGFCSSFSCGIKVLIGGLDCGRMSCCCCCYLKVGGVVCVNGEKTMTRRRAKYLMSN